MCVTMTTTVQLAGPRWCVDGARAAIAAGITARVRDPHDAALLRAFAVGDTRGLSQDDWAVARANGVSHLIAISGFHVGVAAVFGVWLAWLGYALLPRIGAVAAATAGAGGRGACWRLRSTARWPVSACPPCAPC